MSGVRSADRAYIHAVRAVKGEETPVVEAMPEKPFDVALILRRPAEATVHLEHERDYTVLFGAGCHPLLSTPWAET